jgi:ABC-type multidrug transport system ATPase subunit
MDYVIEAERVTGGYGPAFVLRELSMRVPRGSIYGFLGLNGAGKRTALRMFLGLLRPLSGAIRLFGQSLPGALPKLLGRVGSLIEQPSLYDHLMGEENLEIIRRLKGLHVFTALISVPQRLPVAGRKRQRRKQRPLSADSAKTKLTNSPLSFDRIR